MPELCLDCSTVLKSIHASGKCKECRSAKCAECNKTYTIAQRKINPELCAACSKKVVNRGRRLN